MEAAELDRFDREIRSKGWVMFEAAVPAGELAALRHAVLESVDVCGEVAVGHQRPPPPLGGARARRPARPMCSPEV